MRPASYVIVNKATGQAVREIWSAAVTAKVNTERYAVVPILEYLYRLNRKAN